MRKIKHQEEMNCLNLHRYKIKYLGLKFRTRGHKLCFDDFNFFFYILGTSFKEITQHYSMWKNGKNG